MLTSALGSCSPGVRQISGGPGSPRSSPALGRVHGRTLPSFRIQLSYAPPKHARTAERPETLSKAIYFPFSVITTASAGFPFCGSILAFRGQNTDAISGVKDGACTRVSGGKRKTTPESSRHQAPSAALRSRPTPIPLLFFSPNVLKLPSPGGNASAPFWLTAGVHFTFFA